MNPQDPTAGSTPPPIPPKPTKADVVLDDALEVLTVASQFGAFFPGWGTAVAGGAALASKFLAIATAAIKAHEANTGKPLDLTQLHQIEPIP